MILRTLWCLQGHIVLWMPNAVRSWMEDLGEPHSELQRKWIRHILLNQTKFTDELTFFLSKWWSPDQNVFDMNFGANPGFLWLGFEVWRVSESADCHGNWLCPSCEQNNMRHTTQIIWRKMIIKILKEWIKNDNRAFPVRYDHFFKWICQNISFISMSVHRWSEVCNLRRIQKIQSSQQIAHCHSKSQKFWLSGQQTDVVSQKHPIFNNTPERPGSKSCFKNRSGHPRRHHLPSGTALTLLWP